MMKFSTIALATLAMTGVAYGDAHSEKKKAPDKGAPAKAEPPKKLEAPKPPAEVDAMAKTMAGTWKCKGDSYDGDAKVAVTATNKAKLDLDKFWIAESLEVKTPGPMFKMASYTTFDATAKKWRRVSVDNMGGYMVGTSDGLKDNKMDWNLDTVGPQGTGQFRDHIDASDAKAGAKFWGEMSTDKGKTWKKVYEMTCKK